MKTKLILITSLAFIFAGIDPAGASADYISTVENTPNLLGYWRFSPASQANSEVNGYTGTFTGAAVVGPAGSGQALASDPSNSALLLDGSANGGNSVSTSLQGQIGNQGSIVGWFNLGELPSSTGHFFYIAGESQVGNDFDVQIETDNELKFYTEAGGHTTDTIPFTSADLNTWHFFAATFSGNSDRNIYIDGTLVAASVPGNHTVNTSTFNIGESDVFTGRFFGGGLDEIAVYNRDLSSAEIANIYNSRTIGVPEPSTITLLIAGSVAAMCWLRRTRRRTL